MKIIALFILFLSLPAFAEDKKSLEEVLRITENDMVEGDRNAPATLVEYASLSCPHCASFHKEIYPALKEKYIGKGKLRYVYRNFPLNDPALKAAIVVECMPKEKRLSLIQVLFKSQEKWAFDNKFIETLKNISKIAGLKETAFDACMKDKKIEEEILKIQLEASKSLNINRTPSAFLNGKNISSNLSKDLIEKEMEEILSKLPQAK